MTPAETLEQEMKKIFKENDPIFFIPKFTERDNRHEKEMVLFRGYVFIGYQIDNPKVPSMHGNQYFEAPLKTGKKLSLIPNHDIERMKVKLKELRGHDFLVGKRVKIENGVYRDLEGEVVDTGPDFVMVQIILASKEIMVRISPNFLSMLDC